MRSALDVAFKRLTVIKKTEKGSALCDAVAIGTPVWVGKMSTPVRTYLFQNQNHFKKVGFFLVGGGAGNEKVFADMAGVINQTPAAALALTEEEVATGKYTSEVDKFVAELNKKSASSSS